MSRSYKKTPVIKDSGLKSSANKSAKQIANRTVRRKKYIPNGGGYKKIYCSWNICDYRFMQTEAKFKQRWDNGDTYLHETFKTYEQALFQWKKWYKLK